MHTQLFLLGGSEDPFYAVAERLVPASGGKNGNIALLISGSPGWEEYVSHYTAPWVKCGIGHYEVIVPNELGLIDHDSVIPIIKHATGIFIGGGHTQIYQSLFATDPLRQVLHEQYDKGIPFAGLSAGALLTPTICAIPPSDTGNTKVAITPGLGFLSDMILGVHFSECNALPYVLDAMTITKTVNGIGIDEATCIVMHDGKIADIFGGNAYQITMNDFKTKAYDITPISQ